MYNEVDNDDIEKLFYAETAKNNRSVCKKCKQKCQQGKLRISKIIQPFNPDKLKHWHHLNCIFEIFSKQRPTTKRIESPDNIIGWNALKDIDKDDLLKKIIDCNRLFELKTTKKKRRSTVKRKLKTSVKDEPKGKKRSKIKPQSPVTFIKPPSILDVSDDSFDEFTDPPLYIATDQSFKEFRRLVANIAQSTNVTEKTSLIKKQFTKGSDGKSFKGDLILWCQFLLPSTVKRTYNLQNKQLTKLFSKIFDVKQENMLDYLEETGDIGETIQYYFQDNKHFKPSDYSTITMNDVEIFLKELSILTKEDKQLSHFKKFACKCTANDLKIIIRLIVHDLRINVGIKHVLDGIRSDAYQLYQSMRDIKAVIKHCMEENTIEIKSINNDITPSIPVSIELIESLSQIKSLCSKDIFVEIKYKSERMQIHKIGNKFKYISKNFNPVIRHKIAHLKDSIPKAFANDDKNFILDCELIKLHAPNFESYISITDCIYYIDKDIQNKPLKNRIKFLKSITKEIPKCIVLSTKYSLTMRNYKKILLSLTKEVIQNNREGLLFKDGHSLYEPNKIHWYEIKKDTLINEIFYLHINLNLLGVNYETENNEPIFLMGCYNKEKKQYVTVTRVELNSDLINVDDLENMIPVDKTIPKWLDCNDELIPDFVVDHPKNQPIWQIISSEICKNELHTAKLTLNLPWIIKIINKNEEKAITLPQLSNIYKQNNNNILDSFFKETKRKRLPPLQPKRSPKKVRFNDNKINIELEEEIINDISAELNLNSNMKTEVNSNLDTKLDSNSSMSKSDISPEACTKIDINVDTEAIPISCTEVDIHSNAEVISNSTTEITLNSGTEEVPILESEIITNSEDDINSDSELVIDMDANLICTEVDSVDMTYEDHSKHIDNKIEIDISNDNREISELRDNNETDDLKENIEIESSETVELKQYSETGELKEISETDDLKKITETDELKVINEINELKENSEKDDLEENSDTDEVKENSEVDELKENIETNELKKISKTDELKKIGDTDDLIENNEKIELEENSETDEVKENSEVDELKENNETEHLEVNIGRIELKETDEIKNNEAIEFKFPIIQNEADELKVNNEENELNVNSEIFGLKQENEIIELEENNKIGILRKENESQENSKTSRLNEDCKIDELKQDNEISSAIPNFFQDIKLLLCDGVREIYSEWIHYFLAYGGIVLRKDQSNQADFVLHLYDTVIEPIHGCPPSARHVIINWIRDSVQRQQLQDYRIYTVRWNPDFGMN